MRYLTPIFFFIFLLITPLSFVFAHGSTSTSTGSMMGGTSSSDDWMGNMMRFEDNVVNDDSVHKQMEEYMDAMMDGTLTDEQKTQIETWMRSGKYQPAIFSVMMRSILGNDEDSDVKSTNMMGSWGHGGFAWFGLVTMILIWGFLILGMAAFWKSLNSSNK